MTERLLLCDNLPTVRRALAAALRVRGWLVVEAGSAPELDDALSSHEFDVALVDPRAVGVDARDVPARFGRRRRSVDVLLMTHSDGDAAIAAMGAGAADYLRRPFDLAELEARLFRLRRDRGHRRELERLRSILYTGGRLRGFSESSPSSREVCDRVHQFADLASAVLVTGECGTGKKVVAAALHELGARRSGPFVTVRCADVPADLHDRVTAALAQAQGGTLLLHSIDACDDALQDQLVELLSHGNWRHPEGGGSAMAEVRLIATSALDLEAAAAAQQFRNDLWEVLRRLQIKIAPLRQRADDIPQLASEFLQDLSKRQGGSPKTLAPEAAAALRRHGWPGNVTELHHALAAAVVHAVGSEIGMADLPTGVLQAPPPFSLHLDGAPAAALPELLQRMEREVVEWALGRTEGNAGRAAEILGVPVETVKRLRG